jgi:7-cyano-7-deazaguanine synthase
MTVTSTKKAIVLSSGGLDSTTVMAIVKELGYEIYSLTFNYGQRHVFELKAAEKTARRFNAISHMVIDINLRAFGGSALTDDIDVPKNQDIDAISNHIPVTYVPARNTIFLSYALAWAEVLPSSDIYIGVNAVDYSGYPDCRPAFIDAFEKLANLATKAGVEENAPINIHTPLIHLTKAQIIQKGMLLGVDYAMTHSCYDPTQAGQACGYCDSCQLRKKGFMEAGVPDPTPYA